MSDASKRGKDFEKRIARAIRTKLGIPAYRDGSSGAKWFKGDIRIQTFEFQIEAKSQATIKLREWWDQARYSTPMAKMPMLLIDLDGFNEVAVVKFDDILNLIKTIQDDTQTIKELRG